MKTVIKNILSFILPFTVLVLVPRWIESDLKLQWGPHLIPGIALLITGLFFLTVTVISFIQLGKGTLAPWSPTQKLVVTGLYRYVRNPMILGVFIALLGESIVFLSWNILIWSACFFAINTIYFIFSEEPGLEKRFGKDYGTYKQHVSRWIPRVTPFDFHQVKHK